MKIQIVFVGKNKDSWLQEAMRDFLQKLRNYAEIQIDICKDEKISKSISSDKIKEIEGERILKILNPDNFIVLLDQKGKTLSWEMILEYTMKNLTMKYSTN